MRYKRKIGKRFKGFRCPRCGEYSLVRSTISSGDKIHRYRECNNTACARHFRTIELVG